MKYTLALLIVFIGCIGLQAIALRASGGKTLKSESNYFSSLARFQTESQGTPAIMLLGSSMTGRLGDRAEKVKTIANFGCDGGSAVVALRAIDEGRLPLAPMLVIEGNTLAYELEHRGRDITAAIQSPHFRLGCAASQLGATARPAAFAYSWLMARQSQAAPSSSNASLPITHKPRHLPISAMPLLDEKSQALVAEITAILSRLRGRGSEAIVVMLPGVPADFPPREIAIALACRAEIPWWDLTENLPPAAVHFTDGLHLDAVSAQKVMMTLRQEL
jgi:hypothetical protein